MKISNINNSYNIDTYRFFKVSNRKKAALSDITEQQFLNQVRKNEDAMYNEKDLFSDYTIENNLRTSIYDDKISLDANSEISSAKFLGSSENLSNTDFMSNFLVKENYYRDQINKNFSGDELKQKLNSLDSISNKVINELATDFSKQIGNFFEARNVDPLNADLNNKLCDEYSEKFNIEEFKNNIINIMNDQEKSFDNIKNQNSDDWNNVLNSGGKNIEYFSKKLNELSNNAANISESTNPTKLEDMNYKDILSVSKVVTYMNNHRTYTMDAYMFGNFLGEEKLKSGILLNSLNLSDSVKSSLTHTIDKSIEIRMNIFTQVYINGPDKIPGNSYNVLKSSFDSFANLSNTDPKEFSFAFSKKLNDILDTLDEKYPSTAECPNNYTDNFNSLKLTLLDDWNDFIRYVDVDRKEDLISKFVFTQIY